MNEAVRLALINYGNFRGRTNRRNYWLFWLFTILISIPIGAIDRTFFGSHSYFLNLSEIFLFLPSIATATRRLHDVGKRGWWMIVPFVNIYLMVQPSGPLNQFEL